MLSGFTPFLSILGGGSKLIGSTDFKLSRALNIFSIHTGFIINKLSLMNLCSFSSPIAIPGDDREQNNRWDHSCQHYYQSFRFNCFLLFRRSVFRAILVEDVHVC